MKSIYSDLAAPGVRQVGKAMEAIMETGCLALLPLRLVNAKARAWELRTFQQLAEKVSHIEIEEVIEIPPEIGEPILEALRHTSDESLRELYLNLLASSASSKFVGKCHPSYCHVIGMLSPDEAKLISKWSEDRDIPFLHVGARNEKGGHVRLAP